MNRREELKEEAWILAKLSTEAEELGHEELVRTLDNELDNVLRELISLDAEEAGGYDYP